MLDDLCDLTSTATQIDAGIAKANSIQDVNAVVAGLTVTGAEISEAVPLVKNKADLTMGKNLFNSAVFTTGSFLSNTNVINTNVAYGYSDYIPVIPNQQYICNKAIRFTCYYDKNKTYIAGGSSSNIVFNTPIIIPLNVAYIRITLNIGDYPTTQFEKGSKISLYEPYVAPYIKLTKLLKPLESEMFEVTKNLFDKTNKYDGYFVSWVTGALNPSATYCASDFIEVKASTPYFMSGNGGVKYLAWYDAQGIFIGGNQTGSFPLTSPANAKYIRVSSLIANVDTAQLEEGTIKTFYVEHYKLKDMYIQKQSIKSNWEGKKTGSLGDSITAQFLWQPKVAINHSMVIENYGIGGSKISGTTVDSFAEGTRVGALPMDLDLILVMGGTNDWAQNVFIGNINDNNLNTFYGALNILVGLLLTKYPTKRIVFMTTPYGELYNFAPRGWDNAYTNLVVNNGTTYKYTTADYAEAIRQICKKYNLPCIEIHNQAGWNASNIRSYITDDGGLLHPNALGAARISNIVSDALYGL